MTFEEMQVKCSVTLTDRLGPEMLTVLEIKGQVLHRVRLHVKVPEITPDYHDEHESMQSTMNESFSGDPVPLPTVLEEESLAEPTMLSVDPAPEQLTYQIIDEGTIHRKKKLIDSRGFTYNVKERGKETTYWPCTVRPKGNYCRATVKERNAQFTTGKQSHNHPPVAGAITATKILTAVKEQAPCDALPKPGYIARRANRLRQRHRPEDPVDLDFVLDETHLPDDFLQADVEARNRRHLVFAVAEQLELLSKAKTWYIDGTFKLVRQPFTQLLTVNAFVRSGDAAKQVPLVYVLMSSRKKKDYKKVLRAIVSRLSQEPSVQKIVLDFERAIWSAAREVLPGVQISGCSFHWNQAMWRKVQELGLAVAYNNDNAIHRYVKLLMALPHLPHQEIPASFQWLKLQATTPVLHELVDYVNNQWVNTNTFPPSSWGVYGQPVRTNNDIEGWHNSLNRRAGGRVHLPFYLLIQLLHRESSVCTVQLRLVNARKLQRIQEGGVRVRGDAVLRCFWCGFSEFFFLTCGIAVFQGCAVCGNLKF
ncbi:uncharacterized protein [Acropora muricata]|uniref:uncharacterized protein n=1 Tax=Acropora muricata TaxID=159855 RepID=UPI0034E4F2E9